MLKPKELFLYSLLGICGLAQVYAQAQVANRLTLHQDGFDTHVQYRNWSGHPYITIGETSHFFDWYPFYDEYHNTIDIAACLRVEVGTKRIFRIDNQAVVGRDSYRVAEILKPLSVPVRLAGNKIWLPVDDIAKVMGYQVIYDQKTQELTLKKPLNPDPLDLPGSCQLFINQHGFYRK